MEFNRGAGIMLQLRAEREARGWTLRDVERFTGIAAPDLSAMERGLKPAYPGWRERLCRVFAASEDELFRQAEADESAEPHR